MSGGHFDYEQYRITQVADDVSQVIRKYGKDFFFSSETISKMGETEHCLRRASEMLQRVDWFISGDDGEDTFHERWEEEVRKCKCTIGKE